MHIQGILLCITKDTPCACAYAHTHIHMYLIECSITYYRQPQDIRKNVYQHTTYTQATDY